MSNFNVIFPSIVSATTVPIILKGVNRENSLCKFTEQDWSAVFGEKVIPCRTMNRHYVSDEPCWERKCKVKSLTFRQFLEESYTSSQWLYFDYKYLHQWFSKESKLFEKLPWKEFGLEREPSDTTLWVGSEGAHTPAHQDTYGCNVVVQVFGRKRWILFPPDTPGLKPTRIPYEESSVYSELNFYCPSQLTDFVGLQGARSVEVSAGDVLVVPRGWWHYVQNVDPLNITLNTWIPHEKDKLTQVSEALVKIFIAQICKDLPQDTANLVVNPNEGDLGDTPLAVLFLQLETVAKNYLDSRRKVRRAKRQKTRDGDGDTGDDETIKPDLDISDIINDDKNEITAVPCISNSDLIALIKSNLDKYSKEKMEDADEVDGDTTSLCFTKAVIDAFCQPNVIEVVRQNLLAKVDK